MSVTTKEINFMKTKSNKVQVIIIALFMGFMSTDPASAQAGPVTQADIHRLEMEIGAIRTEVAQLKSAMGQNVQMGKGQDVMGKPGMGMQQKGGMPMMDDDKMGGAPAQPPMGSGNPPQAPADAGMPASGGMGHM